MTDGALGKRWKTGTIAGGALLALVNLGVFPGFAHAQPRSSRGTSDAPIAFIAVGLASIQPTDDTYVGAPYLDEGLGGLGPGFAVGLNLVAARHFAATVEFSTARLQVTQVGRLVGGRATARVRDSLFTALAGIVAASEVRSIQLMAGLSRLVGTPSLDNVPINQPYDGRVDPAAIEGAGWLAFTSGVDVSQVIGSRLAIVTVFRYSNVPRSRRATEIGLGSHLFRAGVGLKVGLTR